MKIESEQLINQLIEDTRKNLNVLEQLDKNSDSDLNFKPTPEKWSVLECVEHLNTYGDFYLPELTNRIQNGRPSASGVFKSGIIGNYFVRIIEPSDNIKKMKAQPYHTPDGSNLTREVMAKFRLQQMQTLDLLDKARKVDLTKTKTKISISKILKLRLGDTLRFLIAHNARHLLQAQNVLELNA